MFEYVERKLAPAGDNEFILSDGEPDRMGDIIDPDGWQIGKFNPIALFNHSRNDIIGRWQRVRVEAKALRGELELAKAGTSAVVDMARALFDQGLLDTVSVGFRPLERQPIDVKDPYGPQRFTRAELIEASLVSIPANPRARRIAKQFLPENDYRRLCAASGAGDLGTAPGAQPKSGKSAEPKTIRMKGSNMDGLSPLPIGKKIELTEQTLVNLKDQLTALGTSIAEIDQPSDEQQTEVEALTAEIQAKEKALVTLKNVEAGLKTKAVQVAPKSNIMLSGFERKKLEPRDYLYKAMTAAVIAQLWKSRGRIVGADEIVKDAYGNDEAMQIVLKAATNPANTTVAGWAQELVATTFADFMAALPVLSLYPGLSAQGQRYTFGRSGIIKIPLRNAIALGSAGAVNGSFVGEGQPIPVRRASLGSISLTPKKMAVISSFTREMDLHSTPSIEAVVRQAINEDTARAIDAALVDTTAADTIRPAGLKAAANSPVSITPEATLTAIYDKMISDLKRMIAGIVSNGGGANLVLLINPGDALSLQWVTIADGSFPFESIAAGTLRGLRVLQSPAVTAKQPFMVDANEFATVTADTPEFDVSDQATIHEEDTTPLAIGTVGAPATVAAPARSLWQTYSAAVRMILPMNWAMRRTGMVAYMNANVGW